MSSAAAGANRLLEVANLRDWWHVRGRVTDPQGRRIDSIRHSPG